VDRGRSKQSSVDLTLAKGRPSATTQTRCITTVLPGGEACMPRSFWLVRRFLLMLGFARTKRGSCSRKPLHL